MTVRADLDGRRFEQFPTDITFSESPPIQAEPFLTANALEFADVATPQLPVVSLEQHVAEKLHAYTGSYGQDERESTRVKDLVDLVLIAELTELGAESLGRALATTFGERTASRSRLPSHHPRRHGQDRTQSWHAKSEQRSRSRLAMQRQLGYSTLCLGRKPRVVGTPKRGAGANVRSWFPWLWLWSGKACCCPSETPG